MDNFVWRSRARMVANFDLIMTNLFFAYALVRTFFALILISQFIKDVTVWVTFEYALVLDFLVGLRVWIALELHCTTDVGITADEALRQCHAWLAVTKVHLFFGVWSVDKYFSNSSWTEETIILSIGFIVGCLIYLLMMYIVFKFIQELERVVNCGRSESTETNNLEIDVSSNFVKIWHG